LFRVPISGARWFRGEAEAHEEIERRRVDESERTQREEAQRRANVPVPKHPDW
jgi:hypothetical protein